MPFRFPPEWLSELEAELERATAALQERAPADEAEIRRQLAEVEKRCENLLRLAEEGDADPALIKRLAQRHREGQELRDRLRKSEMRQSAVSTPLSREALVADLQNGSRDRKPSQEKS